MSKNIIKVIVIDDDPMVSHLNKLYTQKISNFEVIAELNIENTLDIKKELLLEANLILLDIYLPEKNGIDILKELREEDYQIDIIIISASRDTKHITKSMQLGVYDYLIKPFTFERFSEALQNYKKNFHKLLSTREFEQRELDNIMGKTSRGGLYSDTAFMEDGSLKNTEIPKNISEVTLNIIKSFMLNSHRHRFTVKNVADNTGLSRITVQRYLKFLYSRNEIEMEQEYGNVGRPLRYYKLIRPIDRPTFD